MLNYQGASSPGSNPCRVQGKKKSPPTFRPTAFSLARGQGLEPQFTASKAGVLPLDDPRMREDNTKSLIGWQGYTRKYRPIAKKAEATDNPLAIPISVPIICQR